MPIGDLFILGFFGKTVPEWLKEFAGRCGLGGVILFDYSCRRPLTLLLSRSRVAIPPSPPQPRHPMCAPLL